MAHFRPREYYGEVFGRHLSELSRVPTCAHFFPWFLGGTEEAAEMAGSPAISNAIELTTPV